jgi:hypothetical protein
MNVNSLVTLALLIAFVTFLVVQLRRTMAEGIALPANPPRPRRTARTTEALVLALMGLTIIGIGGTDYHNGGNLLRLHAIQPAQAWAQVGVALAAVAIGAVAVGFVLLGRTSLGVLVMAGGLCAYGLMLNGPGRPVRQLAGEAKKDPGSEIFELNIHKTNLVGADLWVNDVHLGKTPVRMTFDEFFAKVPYWPEPPEGYEEGAFSVSMPEHESSHVWKRTYQRLVAFEPLNPKFGMELDSHRPGPYYARLEHAGEEGLSPGPPGFHPSVLLVEFPQRQDRLDHLLDQARLADYEVVPEWFQTMETYGDDSWIALRDAAEAEAEPQFSAVFDAWATWRYSLDSVVDAQSAWEAFERIQAEVDADGSYVTPSMVSRAVELIAPELNPERLVAQAEELFARERGHCYAVWGLQVARQTGASRPSEGSDRWSFSDQELPARGYVVAHAVWLLDQRLDAEAPDAPNIVEERIVPRLIQKSYPFRYSIREEEPLGMAVALGGPEIERFLLRQDWSKTPAPFPSQEPFFDIAHRVRANPWLYFLAYLDGPVAAEFRVEHVERLLQMARRINEGGEPFGSHWDRRHLNFLFQDLDRGERSLAFQFWPQYRERARTWGDWELSALLHYLVRMEPLSTAEMYVECLKEALRDPDAWGSWLEPLAELPEGKRAEVFGALTSAAQEGHFSDVEESERLIGRLRYEADPQNHERLRILDSLRAGDGDYKPENIANWLEHTEPTHPLVVALAEQDDPELRLLVMGALRAHPTPENRAILARLLNDANEKVRRAAQNVQDELEDLAATPHMTFASDPGQNKGRTTNLWPCSERDSLHCEESGEAMVPQSSPNS